MARRKRQFMEDDDDSGGDDSEGDFEDGEDTYSHKRRRKNGKDDALYGVFGEDSEDEDAGGRGKGKGQKRSDWTKAPVFVSKDKVDLGEEMEVDEDAMDIPEATGAGADSSSEEEDEQDEVELAESSDGMDDSEEPSRVPSPRIREEEDEEPAQRSRMGGIGSSSKTTQSFSTFTKGGIGSFKPEASTSTPAPPPTESAPLPSAFGAAARAQQQQRSFVRSESPASKAATAAPLPAHERAHFSKLSGFGAKMLSKLGWEAGQGLGTTGEGIVIPVESKLRPKGMGIAFKGFKEKTEQSKMEARRRGEVVSEDEDEKPRKGRKAGGGKDGKEVKRSDIWKKPKKIKTKIEHKTYEQIVAEAGPDPSALAAASGIGMIIDATGATPREITSLADVSNASWTPSTDPTRIPEVRHNLRLIAESCKSDLDGLAREAKALGERKRWVANEDLRLRKKVEDEAELISRMQQMNLVVQDINTQAKQSASSYEVSLDAFSPLFSQLLVQFPTEFDRYRLDEIVVAAIAPLVRRMVAQWNPLEEPNAFITTFRTWKRALKLNEIEETSQSQVDVYGTKTYISPQIEKPMTPFESLLWNVWLPKVRTVINNDWSPSLPHPAVRLYEAWSTFLPPFIRDNLLDQLILPKVQKAVNDWNARKDVDVTLQSLIFPWLPHLGLRLEDVLGDARRKVKSLLRGWNADEGVPKDFIAWKDVFNTADWDAMLLKYVVPKLGALLRNDFRVDPRKQDMEPLLKVFAWSSIIRPSIFSQLIETEFFPKWLDILHIWLIQPKVSFGEVAEWFEKWKERFPENVLAMSGVSHGFTRGLQLINKALELGPDAPSRLSRPDHLAEKAAVPSSPKRTGGTSTKSKSTRAQEVTFRSVIEDFAASHNLLFIPTGKAHEKSRMPLFRVSPTADGKGGLLVYILDDAIWAPDGEEYRAITPQDMVLRASK